MKTIEILDGDEIWIFQCNPKKCKIIEALEDEEVKDSFHWKVKQHINEIKEGHIGLIWCSGDSAGIYAITKITSNPGEYKESEAERKYWLDDNEERGLQYRVKMSLIQSLVKCPITKQSIQVIDDLKNLSILKMPRGTNFPVTQEEWMKIIRLINQ
jgi:predicted RNA-binding protein with PUA-like domain